MIDKLQEIAETGLHVWIESSYSNSDKKVIWLVQVTHIVPRIYYSEQNESLITAIEEVYRSVKGPQEKPNEEEALPAAEQ